MSAGSPIYLYGGALIWPGIINAAVVNAAEISPGASPGTISINGNYTQTTLGALKIAIGGHALGQHDRLVVNGPAILDGALQISSLNGFVPAPGDFFDVLKYTSRTGAFSSSTANSLGLTESYTPTSLLLVSGGNAFPRLTFTVSGGNTQTVCVPFQLHVAATDVDGSVTNVTIHLDGSSLARERE